jgi:enoyl-[acyl-carrier-protein] reductase (NADH)
MNRARPTDRYDVVVVGAGYLAHKQSLAGGPITAEDVTATALFLLSDDARMVTGQVVTVDGGWSVSEPRSG